jgi:hypothetical protein
VRFLSALTRPTTCWRGTSVIFFLTWPIHNLLLRSPVQPCRCPQAPHRCGFFFAPTVAAHAAAI